MDRSRIFCHSGDIHWKITQTSDQSYFARNFSLLIFNRCSLFLNSDFSSSLNLSFKIRRCATGRIINLFATTVILSKYWYHHHTYKAIVPFCPLVTRLFEGIEPLTHKLSLRGKRSRYESPALVTHNTGLTAKSFL